MPAEHDVAELMAAQLARTGHHPAHSEAGADDLAVAHAGRARADDFLQRHDVRLDGREDVDDALGPRASIESAAAMHVVGDDADVDSHRGSIRTAAGTLRRASDEDRAAAFRRLVPGRA